MAANVPSNTTFTVSESRTDQACIVTNTFCVTGQEQTANRIVITETKYTTVVAFNFATGQQSTTIRQHEKTIRCYVQRPNQQQSAAQRQQPPPTYHAAVAPAARQPVGQHAMAQQPAAAHLQHPAPDYPTAPATSLEIANQNTDGENAAYFEEDEQDWYGGVEDLGIEGGFWG